MSGALHINIDLDDCVLGWNERLDEEMDRLPCLDGVARFADRSGWDLFDGLSAEQRMAMREILNSPGFYTNLRPLPGAVEAVARLREEGHEVRFVSTVYHTNPTCASEKLHSVERHFGLAMRHHTTLTDDKTAVRGDILIDDRPDIMGAFPPAWRRIVFDRPWNQQTPGPRLRSWDFDHLSRTIWEAIVHG